MTDQEQHDRKDVEHYASSVDAWYNTRLELDKSLLTLSAGGIGLLLTLMSAFKVRSVESLVLYIVALVSFVICLGAVLFIFSRNSTHLEDVIREAKEHDPWLAVLDRVAISTFLAGVIFSTVIGIAAAVRSFETPERTMATDDKGRTYAQDSFNNAAGVRPTLNKSFNGAINTKPVPPLTPQAPAPTPPTSQPTVAETPNTSKGK